MKINFDIKFTSSKHMKEYKIKRNNKEKRYWSIKAHLPLWQPDKYFIS